MGGDLFVLPTSDFGARLILGNDLVASGFASWEFLPGMRFSERAAWWRGGADRGGPHEGLDILWYRTGEGRRLALGAGATVPVAWAGEVVSIVPDFLGVSLFVAHGCCNEEGWRLHSAYGHLDPRPGLAPGSLLEAGDAVGAIASAGQRAGAAPPHLHITLALVAGEPAKGWLDWNTLRDPSRVRLLDPLPLLRNELSAFRFQQSAGISLCESLGQERPCPRLHPDPSES